MESFTLTELMFRSDEIMKISSKGEMVNVEGKVSNIESVHLAEEISYQCKSCGQVQVHQVRSSMNEIPDITWCLSYDNGGCGEKKWLVFVKEGI